MCKACVCFRIVRNTQRISLRKDVFYHRNERFSFKQINANCSDEWVLDGVRVICSIVHRYGPTDYDALDMCLEENISMSAIKLEALTWQVCVDFGLYVLHVCDIDKHTYAWCMTSYVKLCNDGWHAWTTCVIFQWLESNWFQLHCCSMPLTNVGIVAW